MAATRASSALEQIKDCPNCPPMIVLPATTDSKGKLSTLLVARHELTWHEYLAAVKGWGCPYPKNLKGHDLRQDFNLHDDDYPVTGVSPKDFSCYLGWINAVSGKNYRLPTSAEWTSFAQAGTSTRYPWGEELGMGHAIVGGHINLQTLHDAFPRDPADERPVVRERLAYKVEYLKPNPWGLYDVIGNVFEITSDTREPMAPCMKVYSKDYCTRFVARGWDLSIPALSENLMIIEGFAWKGASATFAGFRIVRDK